MKWRIKYLAQSNIKVKVTGENWISNQFRMSGNCKEIDLKYLINRTVNKALYTT